MALRGRGTHNAAVAHEPDGGPTIGVVHVDEIGVIYTVDIHPSASIVQQERIGKRRRAGATPRPGEWAGLVKKRHGAVVHLLVIIAAAPVTACGVGEPLGRCPDRCGLIVRAIARRLLRQSCSRVGNVTSSSSSTAALTIAWSSRQIDNGSRSP